MDYGFLVVLVLVHASVTVLLVGGLFFIYNEQLLFRRTLPHDFSKKLPVKVLSVVAGHNLDLSEIEKALYSTDINYNLLNYDVVSQDSLLAELEKQVTVFELSSHGLNGQFTLGNTTLPAHWLANALKPVQSLECTLLLYCNSYQDLDLFKSEMFRIGLVGDVKDTTCVLFSRQFYFYLSKKYSYKEAFDSARLHLPIEDFSRFICRHGR